MRCPGFGAKYEIDGKRYFGCDTWFAADRRFSSSWSRVNDGKSLYEEIEKAFEQIGYMPHIVITGGEPLIYYDNPEFYFMVERLAERGARITFETNGTIDIDFKHFSAYRNCIFSLSVKLSNSKEPSNKRLNSAALRNIALNSNEYYLKFTLDSKMVNSGLAGKEIKELRSILPDAEIYCMPVGESRESIELNDKAVFSFCMKEGYKYSDRLHIRIFDTAKGV